MVVDRSYINIYGDIRYYKQFDYLDQHKNIIDKNIKKISIPRIFEREGDILSKIESYY